MDLESRTGTAPGNQDSFEIDIRSCSPTDCTGLIPAGPISRAEIEHYNELYHFLPEPVSVPETKAKD